MRRLALLASLSIHALIVGGAICFAGDAIAAPTEPVRVFWRPSEATPPAMPPPPSEATRIEPEPELLEPEWLEPELPDAELVEAFEPLGRLPERVTIEPPPRQENWSAKLRPLPGVHVVPPPAVEAAFAEPAPPATPKAYVEAAPLSDDNPPPEYPRRARELGQEGEVCVAASVDDRGVVQSVELLRSCRHPLLNREALRAVRAWRFTPARRNGEPVAAIVEVPVYFRLQEGRND